MSFTKGQTYDGAFIVKELKAEKNSKPFYALHRGDQVLAFAVNRWQNPDAPREILVGCGEGREACADSFIKHQPTVPVFIMERKTDDLWHCAGYFKLDHASDDAAEKNQRVKPFDVPAIFKILFLTEVPIQP
jgi:hypothetical protein